MANYNDGIIPFGSRILQMSSSLGVGYGAYIAENFETTQPAGVATRNDEVGNPKAAYYWTDWKTGTATLQLPTTGSQYPQIFDTFSTTISGSSEKFVINQVGTPESNTTDKKISVQFRKVIN